MNRVEMFVASLEKEMRDKKIKKGELYSLVTKETVARIFNQYTGTLDTLKKIADYIDSK